MAREFQRKLDVAGEGYRGQEARISEKERRDDTGEENQAAMKAERQAGAIRLRAERRAGQLLKDMKEKGQRRANDDGANQRVSPGWTSG